MCIVRFLYETFTQNNNMKNDLMTSPTRHMWNVLSKQWHFLHKVTGSDGEWVCRLYRNVKICSRATRDESRCSTETTKKITISHIYKCNGVKWQSNSLYCPLTLLLNYRSLSASKKKQLRFSVLRSLWWIYLL